MFLSWLWMPDKNTVSISSSTESFARHSSTPSTFSIWNLDHGCPSRLEIVEVPLMRQKSPQHRNQKLYHKRNQKRHGIRHVQGQKPDHHIHDKIGNDQCQRLAVNNLRNRTDRNMERVIGSAESVVKDSKQQDHDPVAPAIISQTLPS